KSQLSQPAHSLFSLCSGINYFQHKKEKTMNLVDAFVKKVISGPYEEYGKWWIDVEYISWGVPGKTRLMFESKEQALEVKEGYKFLT
ncbi:hypothetical protein ACRQN8_004976, partial [Escherichia coli]